MKKNLVLSMYTLLLFSCSSSSTQETSVSQDQEGTNPEVVATWSIPKAKVLDGGPGKDGIPALENPRFVNILDASFLKDSDFVIGFKNGDDVRAYPHIILDWHEIINDNINDISLALTYCPLTGTGIGWNRVIDEKETTFGVSGLLYNSNLIPYDRETGSNWSQILNEAVNGSLRGQKADLIQLVETDWKTWRELYPNSKVVGLNTGFSRTYGTSPYGSYSTDNDFFLFLVDKDPRLPSKERVHAIVNGGNSKAYRFNAFESTNIIKDSFMGRDYLIVGNENFIISFELDAAQQGLNFEYVFDGTSKSVLKDDEGNQYNIFGEVISGSAAGTKLKASASFMAYWFSVPAFYETALYDN